MSAEQHAPAVGHVLRTYLPRTETFIYSLLRAQRAFQPVVLAQRTENLEEFPLEPVVPVLARGAGPLGRVIRRGRSLTAGAPSTLAHRIATEAHGRDCVLLHAHFGYAGCSAAWASRELGLPLVTTFYGWDIRLGQRDPAWAPRYAELFSAGDLFVCEGSAMAAQLAEAGCPEDRIRIVRIGIELERFPFSPPRRSRPLIVAQPARLVEKKGVDLSIRAFAAARRPLGEAELWIIGDGPLRGELEELCEELGVGDAVRFLGSVSYDQYRSLLSQVHVGIQPSRTTADGDTEGGAPTVLLELQAIGIPVLATRHADIPEVVAAGDQLVPENDADGLSDALVRVLEAGEDEWLDRARRGRQLVEREHDVRRTSTALDQVYRSAIEAAASARR